MPQVKVATDGCPTQVLALVDHLRGTGTGESKLNSIIQWGIECQQNGTGAEGFMEKVKTLPPITVGKIEGYLADVSGKGINPEKLPSTPASDEPKPETPSTSSQETASKEVVEECVKEDIVNPVVDMNAHDAIDHIGRMRSVELVEHIILTDERVTVKRAAEAKLQELNDKTEASEMNS